MNRTARCALLVLGFQPAWSLAFAQPLGSPPQDPIAGARVFGVKGCTACHAATRAGPPRAPDLRHATPPRSLSAVASALWNHRPSVQQFRVRDARLDARETGNLLAFLFTLDYWDADGADGDARAGRRLFMEKQCVVCHQVTGTGGVVGPRLDSFRQYHSPMLLAAIMWNHGPQMAEVMQARGIERPPFRGTELRDLIAYLKSESVAADPGPLHLLPGDAERGRRIFADKHCIECHSGGGRGPSLIGRGTGRDLTEFATAMWNKTPAMMTMMKRRAIKTTPLRGDEMADLVAYLDSVGYFASSGDAKRGRQLAGDKGCLVCHLASDLGATVGRELIWPQGRASQTMVISFAWNHSLIIDEAAGQATVAWRPLRADEMLDLMAFVGWRGREWTRDDTSPKTIQAP
jgi:cytochrome c2